MITYYIFFLSLSQHTHTYMHLDVYSRWTHPPPPTTTPNTHTHDSDSLSVQSDRVITKKLTLATYQKNTTQKTNICCREMEKQNKIATQKQNELIMSQLKMPLTSSVHVQYLLVSTPSFSAFFVLVHFNFCFVGVALFN